MTKARTYELVGTLMFFTGVFLARRGSTDAVIFVCYGLLAIAGIIVAGVGFRSRTPAPAAGAETGRSTLPPRPRREQPDHGNLPITFGVPAAPAEVLTAAARIGAPGAQAQGPPVTYRLDSAPGQVRWALGTTAHTSFEATLVVSEHGDGSRATLIFPVVTRESGRLVDESAMYGLRDEVSRAVHDLVGATP
jgi:hypothetical protein